MSVIRFLFLVLSLYFLYRLVFHLIIPVLRVSRKMKQQVRDFNERMQPRDEAAEKPAPSSTPAAKAGEYIDFEEIR